MKKYLAIKLTSGSDIIGKLVKTTENEVILTDVMLIISSVYENGSTLVLLRSWATLSADNNLNINSSHIITTYTPHKDMIEYYEVMIEYNKKFIEKDILSGMGVAIKMIKKVLDTGINYPLTDDSPESPHDDITDFYSNLSKPAKKKAH